MKCQSLFSVKNQNGIVSLSSADLAKRAEKVKRRRKELSWKM